MNNCIYSVLVVDDEHLIAKNIAKNIERLNPAFRVIDITHNGEDALTTLKTHMPNVLFTDIRMPVMDGLELIKEAQFINPSLKCVIVSGYNDFAYAKQAIVYRVSDYLLKPINFKELEKLLKRIEMELLSNNQQFMLDNKESCYTAEELVTLTKEFIKKNYQSPIDLSTLACQMGFSSSYLTKIFKKHTGTTPSRYIRDVRISIAKQLLNNPDLLISDIANSVGYQDPFHFSKSFSLQAGVSPSTYRESLGSLKSSE